MPKQVLLGGVSRVPQLYEGVAYSGNSSTQTISTSFSPDLVIAKRRTTDVGSPSWFDSVRGDYLKLESDGDLVEYASNTNTIALETDGFSIGGASLALNTTGNTYIAWCFRAGGTAVSNTNGAITSSVSANPYAGFSIVSYSGNSSTGTIGHGLSQTPELVITKNRTSGTTPWYVGAPVLGTSYILYLDDNAAKTFYTDGTGGSFYNYSGWDSSVYNVYNSASTVINKTGEDYVAYCFHSVPGVSKIGTYTGNGSTTGPTVTTGFRPKFILFKRVNGTSNWLILDDSRSPSNPANDALFFDLNIAELESTTYNVDLNSDGFAVKATSGNINGNGDTYLYVAFA